MAPDATRIEKVLTNHTEGIIYVVLAFFLWGILPIYWKLLSVVTPLEILAHRILWSFIFIALFLTITRRSKIMYLLRNGHSRRVLIATSLLIGLNWFTYVFAVNSNRIVEASMGYYINPLVSVFLGLVILKERLNVLQLCALIIALIGVLYSAIDYARVPWIALILAFAFGFYGLLKKTSNLASLPSLMVETMFLCPLALVIIVYQTLLGRSALTTISWGIDLLLIGAGVVTVLPLYWFAEGTKRIHLSSVGFFQYIAPTLMLCVGVFLYNEVFTTTHAVSFGLIWCALLLYTVTLVRGTRNRVSV
jgi:chloramphenicol-sensitive protein RarD